jgi:hypothetical protein
MNSLLISVLPLLVAAAAPDAGPQVRSHEPEAAPSPGKNIRKNISVIAVADGTIELSSELVEVDRGFDAAVTIADTDSHYIYATVVDAAGAELYDWERKPHASQQTFDRVVDEIHSVVIAVDKSNAADVIYGPVVVVKPKG